MEKQVIVVGGGPSGLFAAWMLLKKGFSVSLYEKTKGVGKKFLVAGKSGLNLTHSSSLEEFSSQYGKDQSYFKSLLDDFSNKELVDWASAFGVETFVGSSGRVFPKDMKAAKFLKLWLDELKSFKNFKLFTEYEFESISSNKEVLFSNGEKVCAEIVIFALGGGSWRLTGSDGAWIDKFRELGLKCAELRPSNCGFEVSWSNYLLDKVERVPLKNIRIFFNLVHSRGEVMITPYGLEGTGVYEISDDIVRSLDKGEETVVFIDLFPDTTLERLREQIKSRKSKDSFSNFLRKSLRLSKEKILLVNEYVLREKIGDTEYLETFLKAVPVKISKSRSIDEAISTSGGIRFDNLTSELELKEVPGVYFSGEMLDFSAPTGGYLLQACFSTAFRAAESIINK